MTSVASSSALVASMYRSMAPRPSYLMASLTHRTLQPSPFKTTAFPARCLSSRTSRPYASLAEHRGEQLVTDNVPVVIPVDAKGKGRESGLEGLDLSRKPAPPKPARRTLNLKPKKAAISLTPTALLHLRRLLSSPTNPQLIRVSVKNRGCAGLAYHLEYVAPPGGKFDEVVEQDGVKVLIDSKALFSIIGCEMDWVEDRLSAKFVFKNPNVKDACGCGESFNI